MTAQKSGNAFDLIASVLLAVLAALAVPAQAALEASLDRYSVAMGDTLRLSLRSDDDSDPADADLSALEERFEILQRSSNVSTRIINGDRSQTRELTLEVTPRREGSLIIPAFEVDGKRSAALSVTVGPAPTLQATDEVVIFEAEVDRSQVYVQGQLLLTLRVQQAVNLDSRSISELDIDNAYVETLGQNSFQRSIDGRPWLVHEIRYAIFPQSSGEIVVPEQTFSGRIASGRRTLFDTRPAGRLLRRRSEALVIPVLPRPVEFPDATWLPSSSITVDEQWSGSLDDLRIGDSVTRTITVTADGLQGAQLPPIESNTGDGLRGYPDQPLINDVTGDQGVTGIRSDSLALVAVSEGEYELPAVEIPWWDTQSDSLKIARLPARRLTVAPSRGSVVTIQGSPPNSAASAPGASQSAQVTATNAIWPAIAGICALGWLGTSLLWWRRSRGIAAPQNVTATPAPTSPRAVLSACKNGDAVLARRELRAWLMGKGHPGPLSAWLAEQDEPALSSAVADLERALYQTAKDRPQWDGQALASAIEALPKERRKKETSDDLPALYLSQ